MKNQILFILLIGLTWSCSNDTDKKSDIPAVTISTPDEITAPPPVPPTDGQVQVDIPAGIDGVTKHYVCEKNDGGFGDAAGPCPICGATMAHNKAFHGAQQNAQPGNTPNITMKNADGSINNTATTLEVPAAAQKPAEPAQNAKGVWHYTCTNGCAGGGGSASPCATCGTALVHNANYHN